MKKIVLAATLALIIGCSHAYALTINAYSANNTTAINAWISDLGGNVSVLENFESVSTGWYKTLTTALGTFNAGGDPGIGDTSYNANNSPVSSAPYFSIRDTAWYGRMNTTEEGSKYLDSGDITKIRLDLEVNVSNIFFFLQDPSDVSATTIINSDTTSLSFTNQPNGSLWFIGISSGGDWIDRVTWTTSNRTDGYGLDDFTTVKPVPEPGTMLFLGFGLFALGIVGRKTARQK